MTVKFGYCIEKYSKTYHVSPATLEESGVRCHDLSGFNGSWLAKPDSLFIFNEENKAFDSSKLQLANHYVKILNDLRVNQLINNTSQPAMEDFFKKDSYLYLKTQKHFL